MIGRLKAITINEDSRRLAGNFASLVVLRGFQFLIPLITLPYLVRVIGMEKFGLINFALSLAFYFGTIIQYGFGVTATREIARHRDDEIKLAKIYSTTLSASILLAMGSSVVFVVIVSLVDKFKVDLDVYMYSLAFVAFQGLFPIWFFQGMERMKYIAILSLAANVMYLMGLFAMVREQGDYMLVPLLHALSSLMVFVFALWIVNNNFKVKYVRPRLRDVVELYSEGRHAFLTQLAPNLYTNSSVFLLGVFHGNVMVGVLSAATKIIDALGSVAHVFSNAFLPYLSRNIGKHYLFKNIMLAVSVSMALGLLFFSDRIAYLMYGLDSGEVGLMLKVLSIAVLLIFIQSALSTNYLMLRGYEREVNKITMTVSVLSIVYTVPLIYMLGYWGVVITLIVTRVIMSTAYYGLYAKDWGAYVAKKIG